MTHSTAPSEKNQNSLPAQSRCVTVARAKAVKNVWVRIAQIGSRKIAKINFTQRVGTVSSSDAGTKVLDLARATLRTTFRPRFEFCAARLLVDLLFRLLKSSADYADCDEFGKAKFGTRRLAVDCAISASCRDGQADSLCSPEHRGYARPKYAPVRVSILIVSPSLMKRGTLIFFPVSSVAGFVTLLAVSPRKPSGDSIIFRLTDAGSSI